MPRGSRTASSRSARLTCWQAEICTIDAAAMVSTTLSETVDDAAPTMPPTPSLMSLSTDALATVGVVGVRRVRVVNLYGLTEDAASVVDFLDGQVYTSDLGRAEECEAAGLREEAYRSSGPRPSPPGAGDPDVVGVVARGACGEGQRRDGGKSGSACDGVPTCHVCFLHTGVNAGRPLWGLSPKRYGHAIGWRFRWCVGLVTISLPNRLTRHDATTCHPFAR